MKKIKKPSTIPPISIDKIKVTLKKATVEAYLTAVEERSEFINRHHGTNVLKSKQFRKTLDNLCQKEEEKALALYAESEENIAHFTFMQLASACYDMLGPVVEIVEKYCEILQLLGIEVTE